MIQEEDYWNLVLEGSDAQKVGREAGLRHREGQASHSERRAGRVPGMRAQHLVQKLSCRWNVHISCGSAGLQFWLLSFCSSFLLMWLGGQQMMARLLGSLTCTWETRIEFLAADWRGSALAVVAIEE